MTGFEVGLGVAKALGPKIGLVAYRRVHPNDWRRRLAKLAASDVGFRVSKRRIRRWLKASEIADLIDAFVVSGAAGTSDDAADSLDAELCAGRGGGGYRSRSGRLGHSNWFEPWRAG